jgi:hypothetical protein
MCARWRNDVTAFLAGLGPKPSAGHTVQRINPEGHYSCGECSECMQAGWPANCRWATKTEQNRARRSSSRSGKLDAEKVRVIRERSASGVSDAILAADFGIARSLVGKIRRLENWR